MAWAEEKNDTSEETDVWITGIGLISSLGQSVEAHWHKLGGNEGAPVQPVVDQTTLAPYRVHPLGEIDFSAQIPRKGDLRQMGKWQSIGVYAAGLALDDAELAGHQDLLDQTDMIVAAGNGERDSTADQTVLEKLFAQSAEGAESGSVLNEALQTVLRPTLYLAELSNLLAGNISIIHGVTGSSRTFKGEEMAGVSALEDAVRRIKSGQGEIFLVGGAFNAERPDLALSYELCGALWGGAYRPVWQRSSDGGGFVMGSVGAFLVLESDAHARRRGKKPYARISDVVLGRCSRDRDESCSKKNADILLDRLRPRLKDGPLPVLSGASGVEPATVIELGWLESLQQSGPSPSIRAYGTVIGHSLEAHFPAGIALAALAASKGEFYKPFDTSGHEHPHAQSAEQVLVTGWGHWRGEGLALVETVGAN